MNKNKIISSISRRFFFSVILLGIFSIFSYAVFYSTVRMSVSDSYVINLSGQQRFLAQQIAFLAKELITESDELLKDSLKNELDLASGKMERGHSFLVNDKEIREHYHTEQIEKIYFSQPVYLDKKIYEYIKSARQLALTAGSDKSAAEYILSASSPLLNNLDLIVNQYQVENEKYMNYLKWETFFLLLVTLILLFLVWKLVFKPAKRGLHYYINELIKKDNDLMQANIDLEKKAEERAKKIKEKENIYRMLVENMNEGLAHYTMDGNFSYINDKYCEILGYKREELINQPIFKVFFEKDVEKIKYKLSLRKNRIGEKYEMMMPRKNGGAIWLHINSIPIWENDKPSGVMVVITDISEKKNTELLLADLNQFNDILLQTIPLGMQVVDVDGNILYSNKAMKELAGFETTGKKCWTAVHDSRTPCHTCLRTMGIEQGKLNICELQEVFDGKTVHIYQSGINYHNRKAILELYIDITLLKEAEKKLAYKNKELQTFISRASHDMRSPVANILGLTSILQKKCQSEEKQLIDYIEQSANRMDNVLIELINIGKVYNNSLNIIPVDLEELLRQVNSDLIRNKEFLSVKFSYQVNLTGEFYSDKYLLHSIIQNLIDNAVKYRGKKDPYVSVDIKEHKNGVQMKVSDNGQGMSPEVQERAFEMFFRGNLSSSGSGLGLYMTKTFVEKLGGEIKLRSGKGAGTTVTVYLPDLLNQYRETPAITVDNAHLVL